MADSLILHNVELKPSDDGVTHINVYSNGKTELGRWLSNFSTSNTETEHGTFVSLEGFYHYLKVMRVYKVDENDTELNTTINRLKSAYGVTAKMLGAKLRKMVSRRGIHLIDKPDDAFNRTFEEALYAKMIGNEEMLMYYMDERSNGLPFVHYYNYEGKLIYKPYFDWIVDRINAVDERVRQYYYANYNAVKTS